MNNHRHELLFIVGQLHPPYYSTLGDKWLQLSEWYGCENTELGRVGWL